MKRTIIAGAGWCAVIEYGRLMEYIPSGTESVSGSILTGRVGRLMPGMNCAFIEIGRKKNGFLPLDEESNSFTGGPVRSGETLLLQIKKEETGEKGAFLTRDITLAGSLVIVMPMNRYIGVSGRIKEEAVRDQLKQTGTKIAGGRFGLVMRNAAEGADENEIRAEAETLFVRWKEIEQHAARSGQPGTVFNQDDPLERLKADYISGGYEIAEETGEPGPEIKRQLKEASERTLRLPGGGNIVRGHDGHRREYRFLRRSGFQGNVRDENQPGSLRADCPAGEAAEPGRHHPDRLYRHGNGYRPKSGFRAAGGMLRGRPDQDRSPRLDEAGDHGNDTETIGEGT